MKNWKTSIAGAVAAALSLFANGTGWKQCLVALGMLLLGLVSKDANVTGGTVPQATPPEAMPSKQADLDTAAKVAAVKK